jgi:hypothetical protein
MAQRASPTAWVGWVYFAGAMLLVVGGLEILSGLVALFRDNYYVVTSAGLVGLNFTAWGIINIILGVGLVASGLGVWSGNMLARMVAVFLTVLALLDNLAFMSAYPLWSIIGVIVCGLIIYALTLHGDEVRST